MTGNGQLTDQIVATAGSVEIPLAELSKVPLADEHVDRGAHRRARHFRPALAAGLPQRHFASAGQVSSLSP